jgi:hypothetical protein
MIPCSSYRRFLPSCINIEVHYKHLLDTCSSWQRSNKASFALVSYVQVSHFQSQMTRAERVLSSELGSSSLREQLQAAKVSYKLVGMHVMSDPVLKIRNKLVNLHTCVHASNCIGAVYWAIYIYLMISDPTNYCLGCWIASISSQSIATKSKHLTVLFRRIWNEWSISNSCTLIPKLVVQTQVVLRFRIFTYFCPPLRCCSHLLSLLGPV